MPAAKAIEVKAMNVVLLVVDSLRSQSLPRAGSPTASFFDTLGRTSVAFRRAYATECWTLPTHVSIFTGLLPSEHRAHFQTMSYRGPDPTIAELLRAQGFHTELVTRNSVLDGSIPGVTRGFERVERILSDYAHGLNPLSIGLAASKPRFRRQILRSGFFHPLQRDSREFLVRFAKATLPADDQVLTYALHRMEQARERDERLFLVCNLYDVHAPYPPSFRSIFRPWTSVANCIENVTMPFILPYLGGHAYLADGFRLSDANRRALLSRYECAIALMAEKLEYFVEAAAMDGLLDDTLLIITADHGEAFGEHDLYLHDASVYQTHLHVPLYIRHPALPAAEVEDVVSTRHLFGVMLSAATRGDFADTILDPCFREKHPTAVAQHFYYPHAPHMAPRFRVNQTAVIRDTTKYIQKGDRIERYDLARDPLELSPAPGRVGDLEGLKAA
jgi:arylsulfatase A-like enzyme